MKAVLIQEPGPPKVLQVGELPDPIPGPDEVRLRVRATALNRADLLQRLGKYPPPPGVREDVPGLEASGEVELVGEHVRSLKRGDRVMSLLPGGGYAERVVLHERMALRVPESLSFEEAASIPEAFLTAFDALFAQLDVKMGERLLVHAAGSGVGIAAVQLAHTAGASVFGTAGSGEKLRRAARYGLEFGVNYREAEFDRFVLEKTQGEGVHAVLDFVGGPYWEKNLNSMAPLGRMLILGLLGGPTAEANLATVLKKRLRIMGSVLRSRPLEEKLRLTQEFATRALPLFEKGRLRPVIDRIFPFEEAADAHAYMEESRNFGKIVLRID